MKPFVAIAGSLTLLMSVAATADEDIGVDEAVQLQNAGTIKPFETLNAAALAKHPDGKIKDTELERHKGQYIYSVELRDAAGKEWEVSLDAGTGALLSEHEDK
ncbi:MAG TPA: PepSY domain-containing protein [Dongiaceae bacterium]|nr:PepSY domain-containing protein [Dongiaceae bacterium]